MPGCVFPPSELISTDVAADLGVTMSQGYSTRSGNKDRSFSFNMPVKMGGKNIYGPSSTVTVPMSTHNYVPVITNSSTMTSIYGQIRLGGEGLWLFANASANAMASVLHYNTDGSRKGYGYLYADHAGPDDVLDFTRDKDGVFNKSMQYLPPGNMTYDIYSVSGQGTGGSFQAIPQRFWQRL